MISKSGCKNTENIAINWYPNFSSFTNADVLSDFEELSKELQQEIIYNRSNLAWKNRKYFGS